jgi:hypothetical protein
VKYLLTTLIALTCLSVQASAQVFPECYGSYSGGELCVYDGTTDNRFEFHAVPNCTDASGQHLNFTASTQTFACGTSGNLGTSVDDTEMTNEDFGEFTCTGSENGCTLDAESQPISELSDVTIDSLTTGDALVVVSGALQDFPLLAFDTDTDTGFSSTSSSTPADIPGLGTSLSNLTGRELVIVWAQIPMSAAAAGECYLRIIQDLDGTDTNALEIGHYETPSDGGTETDGLTKTMTLVSAFAPAAGTTANYTVEWYGDVSGNNCYQDEAYMLTVAFLDQ